MHSLLESYQLQHVLVLAGSWEPHRSDIGQQLAEEAEAGSAHVAAVQAVAVPIDRDAPLLVCREAQDRMRVPGRCCAKAPNRPRGP